MLINISLDHSFLNWKKDYLFFLVTMIFHLRGTPCTFTNAQWMCSSQANCGQTSYEQFNSFLM